MHRYSIFILSIILTGYLPLVYGENPPVLLRQVEMNGPSIQIIPKNFCSFSLRWNFTSTTQWIQLTNTLNEKIYLYNYTLVAHTAGSDRNSTIKSLLGSYTFEPEQTCIVPLPHTDIKKFIQNPRNVTFYLSYVSDKTSYAMTTPPLTDIYNDSRTWQYNDGEWVFSNEPMPSPEFPLGILILTISVLLFLAFYKLKINLRFNE